MHQFLMHNRIPMLAMAMLFAVLGMAPAHAEDGYIIGPGDILKINFLSNPRLDRNLRVAANGQVFVPIIGKFNVSNQTISELQEQLPVLLAGAVYRERVDGEFFLVTLQPQDVILEVAEYRPIYVDGNVQTPGRQSFSVGMTVRQAIAAAGGIPTAQPSADLTPAALRNHPNVLMAQLVGVEAEIAVQRAILDEAGEIDTSELEALKAAPNLVADAIKLAREQVGRSSEILSAELSFFAVSVREGEARVMAALRHEESMARILQTEAAEVDRLEALFEQRIVTNDPLTAARRNYLVVLQRSGDAQIDRLEAEASLRALVLRRNETLRERANQAQDRLQELSRQAAQFRAQIELSTGLPASLDTASTQLGTPQFSIFRLRGGRAREIDARPETHLLPGDVLNVSFGR